MNILPLTVVGNPILREVARELTPDEILSDEIQSLIADMRHTLVQKQYGVGLAAPQVGQGVALSVIGIKPTPTRPHLEKVDLVVINPRVVRTYGRRRGMWEGCISVGRGNNTMYGQAMRYGSICLSYLDEHAKPHEADFDGFLAHVLQHETDHLNGILFVDRVKDTRTYMAASEYRKLIKKQAG
jgi:peptide deformylase